MCIRDELLTPDELAEQMAVTRRTVERWHARRIGPPRIKVGKNVFYRRDAVRSWLLASEETQVRGGVAQ